MFGAGGGFHSIHIHGHVFQIVFKDGHELPAPINADTVLVGPGERYDIVIRCDNPGRWMIHDHIDHHTRSEEHTSELQSLMRISSAVFCLKKQNTNNTKYK